MDQTSPTIRQSRPSRRLKSRASRRRCGLSIREADSRRDLLELHTLLDGGLRQAEVARVMGKDPAWVSRSIRRLRESPEIAFRKPCEAELVARHHEQLEALYALAMRTVTADPDKVNIYAIRIAGHLRRQILDFEIRVGMVETRTRTDMNAFSSDQLEMIHAARLNRTYADETEDGDSNRRN